MANNALNNNVLSEQINENQEVIESNKDTIMHLNTIKDQSERIAKQQEKIDQLKQDIIDILK